MRLFTLLALLCASPALAQTDWAARLTEGDVTLRDFHFRSGETLPALRIHYATLGTPHRDAAGHIDNAVMVLHGTGGTGRQFLAPQFADELYGPGQPLDLAPLLRHPARRHRPWPLVQAERRPAACVSRITIMTTWSRRSASCSPRLGVDAAAAADGHVDGLHARLRLGGEPSRDAARDRCRWPACRPRSPAATGCGAGWRPRRSAAIPPGPRAITPPSRSRACAPPSACSRSPACAPLYAPARLSDPRGGRRLHRAARRGRDSPPSTPTISSISSKHRAITILSPNLERIRTPMTWVNSADDFINPPDLGIAEPAARRMPSVRFVLSRRARRRTATARTPGRASGRTSWSICCGGPSADRELRLAVADGAPA